MTSFAQFDPEYDYFAYTLAAHIVAYAAEHGGNSPSIREMCEECSLSVGSVFTHIERLIAYGIAQRVDGKLMIVDATYVPPDWYLKQMKPTPAATDQSETGRKNRRPKLLGI